MEFQPDIKDERLLRKAVHWAERHKNSIPSVSDLAPRSSIEQLKLIMLSWRKAGLGSMIEASQDGELSIHFSLNDSARLKVKELDQRSWIGRAKNIPLGKSAWEVIKLVLAASAGAVATKYFG